MPRRLLLAVVLALALPALAADQWVEVRSPHFSVVTDAGERRGREVALRFEQMRAVFGTLILRNKVNIPVPLQIIAFKNSGGLRRYVPLWKGKPVEMAGFFQSGEDRNFIALDLSSEAGYRVVFHEYAHMLLNANYPPTQLWFDEGFAEYYSTIEIRDKEVQIGKPPPSGGLLFESKLYPVADLFAVTQQSKAYNESGDRRSLFYAQSWLVAHFLIDTGKLPQIGTYFDLVHNQHVPIPQAIQQTFGVEPKQFDRQISDFLSGNKVVAHTYEAPAGIDDAGYTVTRLDEPDVKAILADLHLHSPDYGDQAVREFQEVLAVSPNHAGAHRGLGYAYLRRRQLDQAAEHFRRASELDSTDARVHYYNALLMNLTGRVDDPWAMRKEAETAISLNPEFADAYSLLGAALAAEGDMNAAVDALKKAVRLSPRNEAYLLNLATFSMMAQKWDDAQAVFERLKTSTDPSIAAMATQALERMPLLKANPPALVVRRERPQDWSQYDDPQWRRRTTPAPSQPATVAREEAPAAPDSRPIKFLKGKLVQVDCSQAPAALLTVLAGKATWKLRARDSRTLVVVGADAFSCGWRNRDVSVNYRESAPGEGDLVSLEID